MVRTAARPRAYRNDLDAHVTRVGAAGVVEDAQGVAARSRRVPRETFPRARPAEEPLISEPEEGARRVGGLQIDGDRLRQPDRVDGAARWRRDPGRRRGGRRAAAAAWHRGRRLLPGQAGLAKEAEHVRRPVFEGLSPGEGPGLADRCGGTGDGEDSAV